MSKRELCLAAYDIRDPARLRHVLYIVKDYATGGQKSAYECYLSEAERNQLLERVESAIDAVEDRFFLLRFARFPKVHIFGIAVRPHDQQFFYQG